MTVTYTSEVATVSGLSCFLKLLIRWKGSIYKLVYIDLIFFLAIYYILNFTYKFLLDDNGKKIFENIVKYCDSSNNYIPLSFVLGFYVSIVMTRWWNQYRTIPFPDNMAVFVSAVVHGQDERGRVMRRTIMRYVCLAITMAFSCISPKVKKRFPTWVHFIEAGLLQDSERDVIAALDKKFPAHGKFWLPLVWASSIITRARKEGRIRDDFAVKTLLDEIIQVRSKCALLLHYDRISVPLVYTQVVTLAVYSYFLTAVFGRQWINNQFEVYFPIFTLLQFFFYMGWLKVAESLINPFGDDDDDFELNWMVDRNVQLSYIIVDEMHNEHPELIRDQYWEQVLPPDLPYTPDTEKFRETHPLSSTANLYVDSAQKISASRRNSRYGSQHSIKSFLTNKNSSFTNLLRNIITRSDSVTTDENTQELLRKVPKNLIEDAIEEVDEQLTQIAQMEEPGRPSIRDVFPSIQEQEIPRETTETSVQIETPQEEPQDQFIELKNKREQERLLRIKQNLTKYLEDKL